MVFRIISNRLGETQIFLTLVAFTGKAKSMRINRRYTFAELDVVDEEIETLTHDELDASGWTKNSVKTQDIQKCTQFTFEVDVDLCAVFDKDDNAITNRYLQ
eukprot:754120_1